MFPSFIQTCRQATRATNCQTYDSSVEHSRVKVSLKPSFFQGTELGLEATGKSCSRIGHVQNAWGRW